MSTAKPLTASIAERLGLPKPEPERRPAPRLGPPPSAPASKVHQLRPPEGPERSFVEVPEVAGKKKKGTRRWGRASPELKAEKVKKALELMAAGKTQMEAAKAVDVGDSTLSYWIKAAKGMTPRAGKAGKAGKAGDDVVSLSRELAAATERVEAIKKKLRKLLGA